MRLRFCVAISSHKEVHGVCSPVNQVTIMAQPDISEIEDKIKSQGEIVRQLKAEKADKDKVKLFYGSRNLRDSLSQGKCEHIKVGSAHELPNLVLLKRSRSRFLIKILSRAVWKINCKTSFVKIVVDLLEWTSV